MGVPAQQLRGSAWEGGARCGAGGRAGRHGRRHTSWGAPGGAERGTNCRAGGRAISTGAFPSQPAAVLPVPPRPQPSGGGGLGVGSSCRQQGGRCRCRGGLQCQQAASAGELRFGGGWPSAEGWEGGRRQRLAARTIGWLTAGRHPVPGGLPGARSNGSQEVVQLMLSNLHLDPQLQDPPGSFECSCWSACTQVGG